MKKLFICTITCSSGRECDLIILFQLHGSRLFEDDLIWVGQYDIIPNLHIRRKTNLILMLIKFLSKLF